MKLLKIFFLTALMSVVLTGNSSLGPANAQSTLSYEELLRGVEDRYSGSGFTARFDQISTLAAMDVSDKASGKVFMKQGGKMRWEYEKPETQIIITDGVDLWIYRPQDLQVMVGKAPNLFGDGKGIGFLSDIRQIRKYFNISLEPKGANPSYTLKLLPKKRRPDLADIRLSVEPETFLVEQIVTRNTYKDETRISLSDYRFGLHLNDSLFTFIIPKNVDILHLDEER
ncbi:MAG: outer membrane lipoprotein carrier protein LolA [Thermodesulfobacteriota bacterium]